MMPSKLTLHSLVVFYFVAREESITAAAEQLCLTQPTITYHIRSLEKNIGIKLLDIRRQKVYLTHAGEGLFRYVSEIYQQMTSAEKYLESLKERSLRVGISATFSSTVVTAAAAFEELYPHVKLIVRNSPSFEVAQDVLNSQVDLGVVVRMDYGNPKLRTVAISEEEKLLEKLGGIKNQALLLDDKFEEIKKVDIESLKKEKGLKKATALVIDDIITNDVLKLAEKCKYVVGITTAGNLSAPKDKVIVTKF